MAISGGMVSALQRAAAGTDVRAAQTVLPFARKKDYKPFGV